MVDVEAVAKSELEKGIEQVLKTEFPWADRQKQANDLKGKGEEILSKANQLTGAQRVVYNATRATSKAFESNEAKSELKQIIKDTFENLSNITADHSSTEDDKLRDKIGKLVNDEDKIESIVKKIESYYEKYNKAYEASQAFQNDENNNGFVDDVLRFMRQGYSFLASLGEEIRNTSIIYQVTSSFGEGHHKTGLVSLQDLINNTYVEINKGSFVLRLGGMSNLKMFQWSVQAEQNYKNFTKIPKIASKNWNQGETLEGFYEGVSYIYNEKVERLLGASPKQIMELDDHEIHYSIHTKMNLSYMKGPDYFSDIDKLLSIIDYVDTEDIKNDILNRFNALSTEERTYIGVQSKAEGATFATLGGLVRSLKNVANAMNAVVKEGQSIEEVQNAVAGLNQTVNDGLKDLVSQFLPSG